MAGKGLSLAGLVRPGGTRGRGEGDKHPWDLGGQRVRECGIRQFSLQDLLYVIYPNNLANLTKKRRRSGPAYLFPFETKNFLLFGGMHVLQIPL